MLADTLYIYTHLHCNQIRVYSFRASITLYLSSATLQPEPWPIGHLPTRTKVRSLRAAISIFRNYPFIPSSEVYYIYTEYRSVCILCKNIIHTLCIVYIVYYLVHENPRRSIYTGYEYMYVWIRSLYMQYKAARLAYRRVISYKIGRHDYVLCIMLPTHHYGAIPNRRHAAGAAAAAMLMTNRSAFFMESRSHCFAIPRLYML